MLAPRLTGNSECMSSIILATNQPLGSLDEVEDFFKERYPEPEAATQKRPSVGTDPEKKQEEFRNYEAEARPTVREFYRLNHTFQTHEFALAKRKEFLRLNRRRMGIWEAAEYLNQLSTTPIRTPTSRNSNTCSKPPSTCAPMGSHAG